MDVDKVTDELYALKPAEFVPARDRHVARARRAGDAAAAKALAALRRPSVAAWAANLLALRRPREAQDFLTLGETLREAHRTLDADRLREASRRQHQRVTALAREAAELAREAGQPVSATVSYEIEQTLHSVLADPDTAARWSKARLVKPPSAAVGFPDAAPEAVAARSSEAHPAPTQGKPGRVSRGTAGRTASGKGGHTPSRKTGGTASAKAAGRTASAKTAGRKASGKAGRTAPVAAGPATPEPSRELVRARETAEEAVEAAGLRERELHEARDARRATAEQAEETADRVRHLEQELRAARRTARDAAAAGAEAGAAVTAAERALQDARGAAARAAREVERLER
ncbi:hypothetical protein [Streptomyces sp. NPDC056361]|uniref:hypothetical protein n=1 Tax=Streptomyces sp. NPDC056361 TaxID=3345795 RepID=UPI0035D91DF2